MGSTLALSPKNKASLSGNYRLPLDQKLGKVAFGAIFSYTSSQLATYAYADPAAAAAMGGNVGILQARHLLDLNLNWTSIFGSSFDAGLFGTNVTNQNYYSFVPGLGVPTGFETALVGEPRMYGLRLRYSFGR